jgi:hypothetical protein
MVVDSFMSSHTAYAMFPSPSSPAFPDST